MGGQKESICPTCMEEMDLIDQELQPCICGYEICLWCWHLLIQTAKKDGSDARCPACCSPYDKEKILKRTINKERLAMVNANKKHTLQKSKQRLSDVGKDLYNIRVIRRNIVYIAGIPKSLSDEQTLMKKEYLGQYGKIIKIFFAQTDVSRQYYSSDSCLVYVTFSKMEEALRCIEVVNGYLLNGRLLRASFGTTRYCYSWLKNLPCKNPDCLYVHDVVPEEDICKREEVIPFCTSKLQQCQGLNFSNLKEHSGSFLPPPLDTKNSLPPLDPNRNNRYMQIDYFGRSYASVVASDNQSKIPSMNSVPVMPSSRAEVYLLANAWDHEHVNNSVSTPSNGMPLTELCMEFMLHLLYLAIQKLLVYLIIKLQLIPICFAEDNTYNISFAEDNAYNMSFADEHLSRRTREGPGFSELDCHSHLSTCPKNVITHASTCNINTNIDKWWCKTRESYSNKFSLFEKFNPFGSFQPFPGESMLTLQNIVPSDKFSYQFEDESYIDQSEDSILSDILALDLDAIDDPTETYSVTELDSSGDSTIISKSGVLFNGDSSKSYFSMMDDLYGASGQFPSSSNIASDLKKSSCPEIKERKKSVNKIHLETSKYTEVLNGITLLSATKATIDSRSSLDTHYSGYSLGRATQRTTLSTPPGFPPLKINQGSTTNQNQHHNSISTNENPSLDCFINRGEKENQQHLSNYCPDSWEEHASYSYF